MSQAVTNILLGLSVQTAVLGLLVLLVQLAMRGGGRYPRYFVVLWGAVFLKFVIPLRLRSGLSVFGLFRRSETVSAVVGQQTSAVLPPMPVLPETAEAGAEAAGVAAAGWSVYHILAAVWLAVAAALLIGVFHTYYNTKIRLYKHQAEGAQERLHRIAGEALGKVGISRETEVLSSAYAASPFVFGLVRPLVVIPSKLEESASDDELAVVISHEAMHCKLQHYRLKFLALLIACLHWFNPLGWLFLRQFSKAMEYQCDYELTHAEHVRPSDYAEVLLGMAKRPGKRTVTGLYFGESNLYKRVEAILKMPRLPKLLAAGATMLALCLLIGCFTLPTVTVQANPGEGSLTVSVDSAREAAESEASSGQAVSYSWRDSLRDELRDGLGEAREAVREAEDELRAAKDIIRDEVRSAVDEEIRGELENYRHVVRGGDGTFWAAGFGRNMTYDELRQSLPDRYLLTSSSGDIRDLELNVAGCHLFIVYTDSGPFEVEFLEDTANYKTKFQYSIQDKGTRTEVEIKPVPNQVNVETGKQARMATVFIPKGYNGFDSVTIDSSMNTADIHGLKADKLEFNSTMSSDALYNINVTDLEINNAMSSAAVETGSVETLRLFNSMGSLDATLGRIGKSASLEDAMGSTSLILGSSIQDLKVTGEVVMGSVSLPAGWQNSRGVFSHTYGGGRVPFEMSVNMGSLIVKETT